MAWSAAALTHGDFGQMLGLGLLGVLWQVALGAITPVNMEFLLQCLWE